MQWEEQLRHQLSGPSQEQWEDAPRISFASPQTVILLFFSELIQASDSIQISLEHLCSSVVLMGTKRERS
ncbi:hypothetical protein HHUSO_G19749 [Huso huso]|uniref:Uncharacterized protein n=1 Tax=Huso huso TaxID=61971 RepID=A0ABR0Z2N7_HUSHU